MVISILKEKGLFFFLLEERHFAPLEKMIHEKMPKKFYVKIAYIYDNPCQTSSRIDNPCPQFPQNRKGIKRYAMTFERSLKRSIPV